MVLHNLSPYSLSPSPFSFFLLSPQATGPFLSLSFSKTSQSGLYLHPLSSSLVLFSFQPIPFFFYLYCPIIKVTDSFQIAKPNNPCQKSFYLSSQQQTLSLLKR